MNKVNSQKQNSEYLSTTEAANILKCSDETVRKYADSNKLDCIRTAGNRRILLRESVERLAAERK
jgi:excisionase family DNA binding protein